MGLPANQHTILKHDLHYMHKDARVLEALKAHNILPLFVPIKNKFLIYANVLKILFDI